MAEQTIQKIFGSNVQKFRKKANLTQTELSEKLGISQKHLSVIETGTQFAPASLIEKISNEHNMPPTTLFGGDFGSREVNMIQSLIVLQLEAKLESVYARRVWARLCAKKLVSMLKGFRNSALDDTVSVGLCNPPKN